MAQTNIFDLEPTRGNKKSENVERRSSGGRTDVWGSFSLSQFGLPGPNLCHLLRCCSGMRRTTRPPPAPPAAHPAAHPAAPFKTQRRRFVCPCRACYPLCIIGEHNKSPLINTSPPVEKHPSALLSASGNSFPHLKCIRLGHSGHSDVRVLLNMHISCGLV